MYYWNYLPTKFQWERKVLKAVLKYSKVLQNEIFFKIHENKFSQNNRNCGSRKNSCENKFPQKLFPSKISALKVSIGVNKNRLGTNKVKEKLIFLLRIALQDCLKPFLCRSFWNKKNYNHWYQGKYSKCKNSEMNDLMVS